MIKHLKRLLSRKGYHPDDISEAVEEWTTESYPKIDSGRQVSSYLRSCDQKREVDGVSRLFRLVVETCRLYKKQADVFRLIQTARNMNDDVFYRSLHNIWVKNRGSIPSVSVGDISGRLIRSLIEERYGSLQYLDYGTANGKKARDVARQLGIQRFYGADVASWLDHKVERQGFEFLLINEEDQSVGLPPSSIDLITSMHVLHHIPQIDKVLSEFRRLLKPGGLLLLIEHDVNTVADRILVDIEHSLYERVFRQNGSFAKDYYGRYFSDIELRYMCRKYGFRRIRHMPVRKSIHKDCTTPTQSYMSIFQLTKSE